MKVLLLDYKDGVLVWSDWEQVDAVIPVPLDNLPNSLGVAVEAWAARGFLEGTPLTWQREGWALAQRIDRAYKGTVLVLYGPTRSPADGPMPNWLHRAAT